MKKQEGDRILQLKLESAEVNLNNKMLEISQLKKRLFESEALVRQQQNLFDLVKNEKDAISKRMAQCQGEIENLKEKIKLMTNQIEQLKGDIALKDTYLRKEELASRKIQTQRDSLQEDVQRWRDSFKECKKTTHLLQEKIKDAHNSLKEREFEIEKISFANKNLITEKDLTKQQLMKGRGENKALKGKLKTLEETFDLGKALYAERSDDIRLLRLEIEHLRNEKCQMAKALNMSADYRSAIYHLERNLAKERLKSRALEEELQSPLNIHRWRKLEGSDPSKMELIQKIHILQKRLIEGIASQQENDEKFMEIEQKYELIRDKLSADKQSEPEKLSEAQLSSREKILTLKRLTTKVNSLVAQNAELKFKLKLVNNELKDMKMLQYAQKKREEENLQVSNLKKLELEVTDNNVLPSVLAF